MRAYLLGYNHGKDDGYFSTLIEQGGCERAYDESLDVEYVTIDEALEAIDQEIGLQEHFYAQNLDAPNYLAAEWHKHALDGMRIIREAVEALKGGEQ